MTRAELIALLRNTADWPEDFTWFYNDCRTCAIGLHAKVDGHLDPEKIECDDAMKEALGLGDMTFSRIFYDMCGGSGHVTPRMVADALEELEDCGV